MAKRKRIALLVGQPEENYQSLFINGFLKHAFESDFDVCIFAMFLKYQDSTGRELGESNIFSLIQYDQYDAFVILLDTIQTTGVADKIEDKLKECFDGPVICVDKKSKYFTTIMTDHYTPVKQLVSHLIEHHGYKDIAFLTGKEWHPHSKQRLQGYLDCMAEHNLEVGANRVFYGDFWYTSGANMAEQLLKDPEHMPEAVACANDCMAIGLAEELEKQGLHIPEDMAIVGYDALPEGMTSPKPITSAPIPAGECGSYVADCLKASFENREMPEFHAEVELFIGSSCGCHNESLVPKIDLRDSWETDRSSSSYFSVTNRLSEDLLMQSDVSGFMNTIFSYVYQIREFDSFHLCLNDNWNQDSDLENDTLSYSKYTDSMVHILKCGPAVKGMDRVDLDARFDRKELLPDLFPESETPRAYIFSPLHFEERCYGYAVISYGNEVRSYDETYILWLHDVMQGFEYFRRISRLEKKNALLQAGQIRDSRTGFYNYKGFMENASGMIEQAKEKDCYIDVVALDINGLSDYNDAFGIQGGDQAVVDIAEMLEEVADNGLLCCLGNGEFLGAVLSEEEHPDNMDKMKSYMVEQLEAYNKKKDSSLSVSLGSMARKVFDLEQLEHLINAAVSQKNGNKVSEMRHNQGHLTDEERKDAQTVSEILNQNKFRYHFQPIVNARDGEIYSYEALMRADVEPYISPLDILCYAERLGRLYDVEKATFHNVLDYIGGHPEQFEGKKVFINSIPGNHLEGEDADRLAEKIKPWSDTVVIELTEQAELDDEALSMMKEEYKKLGVETAVDDYGTGYSNISNLLRYMPNYVKIDRMLLTGIQNSPQKQHFVRNIIEFSHDNGIMALAEGVETTDELRTVIRLGADLIQGFYTAKPSGEPAKAIDTRIQNEIIQFNQMASERKGGKVYSAGKESKVSLVKLAAQHHVRIQVSHEELTHRDFTITGVPGFQSNMDMVIGDQYTGRIELQDVSLTGNKNDPAIRIGEKCDVTLVLIGENSLESGGILVPESSTLTIQGDGNFNIKKSGTVGYGIGNGKDEKHGHLIFEQDGTIEIYGDTMYDVGIGSGMGGDIQITKGKYIIRLNGQQGVGIGSLYGKFQNTLRMCDIELNVMNATNVGIGSLMEDAEVTIQNASIKSFFGGTDSVGIGTVNGQHSNINIKDASVKVDMRSTTLCGIGNLTGEADIQIHSASIYIIGNGKQALALGNMQQNASIYTYNADFATNIKSNLETDIGAGDIKIVNGRNQFMLNGKEIVRESIIEEL